MLRFHTTQANASRSASTRKRKNFDPCACAYACIMLASLVKTRLNGELLIVSHCKSRPTHIKRQNLLSDVLCLSIRMCKKRSQSNMMRVNTGWAQLYYRMASPSPLLHGPYHTNTCKLRKSVQRLHPNRQESGVFVGTQVCSLIEKQSW